MLKEIVKWAGNLKCLKELTNRNWHAEGLGLTFDNQTGMGFQYYRLELRSRGCRKHINLQFIRLLADIRTNKGSFLIMKGIMLPSQL